MPTVYHKLLNRLRNVKQNFHGIGKESAAIETYCEHMLQRYKRHREGTTVFAAEAAYDDLHDLYRSISLLNMLGVISDTDANYMLNIIDKEQSELIILRGQRREYEENDR